MRLPLWQLLSVFFCLVMALPLLIDIIAGLFEGWALPFLPVASCGLIGAAIDAGYGLRHPRLGRVSTSGRPVMPEG